MPFAIKLIIFILVLVLAAMQVAFSTETFSKHKQAISLYESLYDAIKMDSENELKQFIAFGAEVDYRYKGDKTPLMLASSFGSINSVLTLIELGANIDLVSKEDMTALDYARKANNKNILAVLRVSAMPREILSERQLITTIQFYLNRLGYISGDVDGIFGTKTKESLKQFSIEYKQPFAPEISPRQIEALYDVMITPEFTPTIKQNNNKTHNSGLKKVITTNKSLDLVNF